MESQSLYLSTQRESATSVEAEIASLEALLAQRAAELTARQEELQAFKARYTQIIGGLLAELADVEQSIREAEARVLGVEDVEATDDADAPHEETQDSRAPARLDLRKLFWSVARMFHPDHAADEDEARRRHRIMAEASRAYKEGDTESLNALLGDEQLQAYCAGGQAHAEIEDLSARLLSLREQVRTVDFGLRRLEQHGLYRLKLKIEEAHGEGRDLLAEEAEGIRRKIVKARRRLAHLS
jgi:hypothetical protein